MIRFSRRPLLVALTTGAAILYGTGDPLAARQQPVAPAAPQAQGTAAERPANAPLSPTVHAALPQDLEDFWLVPPEKSRPSLRNQDLAAAATAFIAGNYTGALASAERAHASETLSAYAAFYRADALLRLGRADDASKAFDEVLDMKPAGYLADAALVGKAEAAEARGDHQGAADIYDKLTKQKTAAPEEMLSRLGRASLAAGDRKRAAAAFVRVFYEYPLSEQADAAGTALESLKDELIRSSYKSDMGRALILFGAKRYADARTAFLSFQKALSGDDRELADLRIAECDYFLKRYAAARDALAPYVDKASRKAEARFFYASAIGALGDRTQYVSLVQALVSDFPDSSWSEEALNNLGTYYILENDDAQAADVFKQQYEKFPRGQHAERAAWKYGWWAYKTSNYAETVRVFEGAAAAFPHSDYRPPYLYWAARARERMGDRANAESRMRLVYTDYENSYYGRLAHKRLAVQNAAVTGGADPDIAPAAIVVPQPPAADPPPNAPVVRALLASGMDQDALNELRYAQKAWGTSPVIEATIAWIYHDQGDLRRAITLMRRAYPQFLASGGEDVPPDILQIIFPLTYWDAIKKHAKERDLDPYLVAALINQESTFEPDAHSGANAWGLMQIVPATGRRLARAVGMRRFSTSMLTNADTNIRLGTLFFSRLIQQFGGVYYALASYNAGESRVVRWKMERPGLEEDEFIDDIPFPETQNYVKRILGTAEDYRRLYGEGGGHPAAPRVVKASGKPAKAAAHTRVKKSKPAAKHRTRKKAVRRRKKGGG